MTLIQLQSLTEEELCIALYIVNVLNPVFPNLELPPRGLTWFKKNTLEQRLVDAFPHVQPNGHAAFSSLLNKLGIKHEINYNTSQSTAPI